MLIPLSNSISQSEELEEKVDGRVEKILASFEKKEERKRTDPKAGEFTPTSLEDYLTCPRLFYFKKVVGINPSVANVAAAFGHAIHESVSIFWKLQEEEDFALRKNVTLQVFRNAWNLSNCLGDEKRNMKNGIIIMENYCDEKRGSSFDFIPELVESTISCIMPNDTLLCGRIDRGIRDSGNVNVIDTKTSSWPLTNYYFQKFQNSFQLTAYQYIVTQIVGSCENIIIDAILVPWKSKDAFATRHFYRTDLQIAEFLSTYQKITDRIRQDLSKPDDEITIAFYQNPCSCDKFGGCKYLNVCKHGLNHPALQSDFTMIADNLLEVDF